MNSKRYEVSMAILAGTTVLLAICDMLGKIPEKFAVGYLIVDWSILLIFAIDYIIRCVKSDNKRLFFKKNIFDLLAIIPFDSLFRGFRLVKLIKVFKVLKISVLLKRFSSRGGRLLRTNGFIYVLWISVVSILIGAFLIYLLEKMNSFGDAVWWAFVTTTTVGYGDISPSTTSGRIVAAILMIIGIGFISTLTSSIATFFIRGEKKIKIENFEDFSDESKKQINDFIRFTRDQEQAHGREKKEM